MTQLSQNMSHFSAGKTFTPFSSPMSEIKIYYLEIKIPKLKALFDVAPYLMWKVR